jgi:hypothetical protein
MMRMIPILTQGVGLKMLLLLLLLLPMDAEPLITHPYLLPFSSVICRYKKVAKVLSPR